MLRTLVAWNRQYCPDIDGFPVPVRPVGPADVLETLRQDADDPRRAARHPHRPADDPGIPVETPHPQRVAQNDPVVLSNLVERLEFAAKHGLKTQELEEPWRDPHAAQLFGSACFAQLKIAAEVGRQPVERAQFGAVVTEVGRGHREVRIGRRVLEQPHEAIRFVIGQRRDQDAFHRAEDRRVRPNRQGQRENCRYREAGRSAQQPDRVACVLQQGLHHGGLTK